MQLQYNSGTSRQSLPPNRITAPPLVGGITISLPVRALKPIMATDLEARAHLIDVQRQSQTPVPTWNEAIRSEVDMFLAADNPHLERMAKLATRCLSTMLLQRGVIQAPSTDLFGLLKTALAQNQSPARIQQLRHFLVFECWEPAIPGMVGTPGTPQAPETADAVALFLHVIKIADQDVKWDTEKAAQGSA